MAKSVSRSLALSHSLSLSLSRALSLSGHSHILLIVRTLIPTLLFTCGERGVEDHDDSFLRVPHACARLPAGVKTHAQSPQQVARQGLRLTLTGVPLTLHICHGVVECVLPARSHTAGEANNKAKQQSRLPAEPAPAAPANLRERQCHGQPGDSTRSGGPSASGEEIRNSRMPRNSRCEDESVSSPARRQAGGARSKRATRQIITFTGPILRQGLAGSASSPNPHADIPVQTSPELRARPPWCP